MAYKKTILLILLASNLTCGSLTTLAQTITFTRSSQNVSKSFSPAVVVDVDGNGLLESLGTLNDNAGNLLSFPISSMGLSALFVPGRPNDARSADFNGDGCPDLITEGYSSTNNDTRALLYFNDGTGRFNQNQAFADLNLRGRGEGVVVADFNNDSYVDIFLPYYTLSCSGTDREAPLCPNAPQAYLFLNNGQGHFREVAVAAGLDFSPGSNAAPNGMQPEGVQAADVNSDGLIDLYVGGRLMINTGIDANGIPHFTDLCSMNMACGIAAPPAQGFRADEGAKFLDWNNDGLLDLVIHNWANGSLPGIAGGPTLYQNVGEATNCASFSRLSCPSFTAVNARTDGKSPFFSTGAPNYAPVAFQDSFGINIYDMDGDGKEDIITTGSPNPPIRMCNGSPCPVYPNAVFRNASVGYELVSAGDISGIIGGGFIAFGDINHDGKIDIIYPRKDQHYFINGSPSPTNGFLSVEMLGPNGERNQYGRIVQAQPPGFTTPIFTRVVDSGSGYKSQNQYPLLIGTSFQVPHVVQAFYASPVGGTAAVSFTMSPGQYAQVFAPSAQNPNGKVAIYNQPPPPAPLKCMDWLRPALDLLAD